MIIYFNYSSTQLQFYQNNHTSIEFQEQNCTYFLIHDWLLKPTMFKARIHSNLKSEKRHQFLLHNNCSTSFIPDRGPISPTFDEQLFTKQLFCKAFCSTQSVFVIFQQKEIGKNAANKLWSTLSKGWKIKSKTLDDSK